jgi:hypothetical protein
MVADICDHDPPEPATCLACCLAGALPADVEPTVLNMSRLKLSCVHLGQVLDFANCGCPWRHIWVCNKFGTCMLEKCQSCPEYVYGGPED